MGITGLERATRLALAYSALLVMFFLSAGALAAGPIPLLAPDHPVDWWFVFKFNAEVFPHCEGSDARSCPFGGELQSYQFGQQFVFASNEASKLQKGSGCIGSVRDPVGATVDQIYRGEYHYVVWNDQFYDDPEIPGCSKNCSSPWGHSKGMLAWDEDGNGIVMQVSTPSWLGAASATHPRKNDGNSLGCVIDDNVKVSQHFFALKLNRADVLQVVLALQNASVVTDTGNAQIVSNGGPSDIADAVRRLGRKSSSQAIVDVDLSSQIRLISKPSALHVPPWQMVSARLGGATLLTATWWAPPRIPSTTANANITCWSPDLQAPGSVQIATRGTWEHSEFGLKGGPTADNNHAKIGVSVDESDGLAIFGDLNQQGTLSGSNCGSSQNGRGGLFFVLANATLASDLRKLIGVQIAPSAAAR